MLSTHLMMEMGRRAQPDRGWWKPKTVELAREAAQQAAYCLDAPEEIPTGRVLWEQVDDDLSGPVIETVPRHEPPNVNSQTPPVR